MDAESRCAKDEARTVVPAWSDGWNLLLCMGITVRFTPHFRTHARARSRRTGSDDGKQVLKDRPSWRARAARSNGVPRGTRPASGPHGALVEEPASKWSGTWLFDAVVEAPGLKRLMKRRAGDLARIRFRMFHVEHAARRGSAGRLDSGLQRAGRCAGCIPWRWPGDFMKVRESSTHRTHARTRLQRIRMQFAASVVACEREAKMGGRKRQVGCSFLNRHAERLCRGCGFGTCATWNVPASMRGG
ncbi:hypothetical protein ASNO1_70070 [Corallococcus caeni]|uniref:Uncharacterized protein n=1 Tax=Corallococcus caeni TaxID=3082388 RepID=A0ABQ6R5J1_9BACT|nr:hypothetical protein ASNO1_70070 [Corallococcus sp. NO1]